MSSIFSPYVVTYEFPSGRRELVFIQTDVVAEAARYPELREHCRSSAAHEAALRAQILELSVITNKPLNPRLMVLDPPIDFSLGHIGRTAEGASHLQGLEVAGQARELLDETLPGGPAAVTTLDYPSQASTVDVLLGQWEGRYAGHIAALGLTPVVANLRVMNDEFRALLAAEPRTGITRDQLRAANEIGQDNLHHLIVMVLNQYPTRSAEHSAARRRLLAPLDRQQEAIRACLRARRHVTDVDPRTGEEVSEVPPAETPAVPAHDGPAPGTTTPTE